MYHQQLPETNCDKKKSKNNNKHRIPLKLQLAYLTTPDEVLFIALKPIHLFC